MKIPFGTLDNGDKYLTHDQLLNDSRLLNFYSREKQYFREGPWNMDIVIYDNPRDKIWEAITGASR